MMPNNTIHAPACLILAGCAFTLPLYTPLTLFGAAQVSAGCALGVIVTPDLDMVNPLSRMPVIGLLYGVWWWPYKKALKHREWGSHVPGVSTIIRAIGCWPLWVGLAIIGLPPWLMIAGLAGADLGHALLDAFYKR
jgi:uncharacterized metal-binding protein